MKTNEFTTPVTARQLNENMYKKFGVKVNFEKYDRTQLENYRNLLRTKISQVETGSNFNDLLANESYQKDKHLVNLLNTRIKEMLGEGKKAKPDFLDVDKDGNKKEPMKKAIKDKKKNPNDGKFVQHGAKVPRGYTMTAHGRVVKKVAEDGTESMPSKTHIAKMCKDGKTTAEICKMHPDCDQSKLKEMIKDCKSMQVEEGWDDMTKAAKSAVKDKGTGKFDQKKTSTGTQYTRKSSTFTDGGEDRDVKKARKKVKENYQYIRENEEAKAKTITASGDMVNDFTTWMTRVGQYQTKSMIELADTIRANFGAEQAEQFKSIVAPALETALNTLTQSREDISNAVAVLAGEQPDMDMMGSNGMDAGMDGMDAGGEEIPGPTDTEMDLGGDEFSASDAAAGGAEGAGRMRRESRELFARKLSEAHSLLTKLSR